MPTACIHHEMTLGGIGEQTRGRPAAEQRSPPERAARRPAEIDRQRRTCNRRTHTHTHSLSLSRPLSHSLNTCSFTHAYASTYAHKHTQNSERVRSRQGPRDRYNAKRDRQRAQPNATQIHRTPHRAMERQRDHSTLVGEHQREQVLPRICAVSTATQRTCFSRAPGRPRGARSPVRRSGSSLRLSSFLRAARHGERGSRCSQLFRRTTMRFSLCVRM
jgi:hypothetical protein